jgi:dipeptidyl aminopeptidase/acylaminoacyl peptidase
MLPHGGPAAHDELEFDWWAQAFAHLGYAVFQPNFRGSDGYGDNFLIAGYGEWGRKMQTDVSTAIDALAREQIIDPARVCVMGGSYGGYVALAGVTVQQGIYKCAVSVAGVSDLRGMLQYARRRGGSISPAVRYWRNYYGLDGDSSIGAEGLRNLSPLPLARNADAPVLLIHGKDDTVVPFEQSDNMQKALRSAGKTVELVELSKEDHWLSTQTTRIEMLKAAAAFIQKYNPAE